MTLCLAPPSIFGVVVSDLRIERQGPEGNGNAAAASPNVQLKYSTRRNGNGQRAVAISGDAWGAHAREKAGLRAHFVTVITVDIVKLVEKGFLDGMPAPPNRARNVP